jgi:hypothetical protein
MNPNFLKSKEAIPQMINNFDEDITLNEIMRKPQILN